MTSAGSAGGSIAKVKPYNILSLDGGGSRGVMETVILRDLMACYTRIQKGEINIEKYEGFVSKESRSEMRTKLDEVQEADVTHPADVFRMVAGTSTGALMAFGFLHGEDRGVDRRVLLYFSSQETTEGG